MPRTLRLIVLAAIISSILIVVALSTWLLLWPMWLDRRIAQSFLQSVASNDSQLIENELEKLKGLHGTQLGIKPLVLALKEGDSRTANYVARGLGKIGPNAEGAVPLLIEGLHHKDDFSLLCLIALGEIGRSSKAAIPAIVELRNGAENPPFIRLHAAFALNRIDPEEEGKHWNEKELTALPEPVDSWGELSYAGSFRLTNRLPLGVVTMKLVWNRENEGPVIMNSANAKPIETGNDGWRYTGQLEARCPPGTYDLVAVVGGTTQVGQTTVTVIQSKNGQE
jgi:hypothetical protein